MTREYHTVAGELNIALFLDQQLPFEPWCKDLDQLRDVGVTDWAKLYDLLENDKDDYCKQAGGPNDNVVCRYTAGNSEPLAELWRKFWASDNKWDDYGLLDREPVTIACLRLPVGVVAMGDIIKNCKRIVVDVRSFDHEGLWGSETEDKKYKFMHTFLFQEKVYTTWNWYRAAVKDELLN